MKTKNYKLVLLLMVIFSVAFSACSNSVNPDKNIYFGIYPNPCTSSTQGHFTLTTDMMVTITIADNYGREVLKLTNNKITSKGSYGFIVNCESLPSGVYNCILNAGGKIYIQEFTVIKI
ncbi:MAG: T9SS type A sorting domain-containing protein [FCB group bacterium]|jgi:hypothetical protein